jgi:hypothetical protein
MRQTLTKAQTLVMKCMSGRNRPFARCVAFITLVLATALPVSAQTKFLGGEGSRTLDTSEHPKAKGLKMRIDFPASWSIAEAKRPNSVAIAISEDGNGLQNCVVGVNTTDQLGWPPGQAKSETKASFAAPARLRAMAEEHDRDYLGGGPAAIENLPSRWFASVARVSRDGSNTVFPQVTYQLLFKNWLISVVCGSGATGREAALASFQRHEVLFRLIANSIVLPQRWP